MSNSLDASMETDFWPPQPEAYDTLAEDLRILEWSTLYDLYNHSSKSSGRTLCGATYYAEMAKVEAWSTLKALHPEARGCRSSRPVSRRPEELARQELEAARRRSRITPPMILQGPFVSWTFLGLKCCSKQGPGILRGAGRAACWSWAQVFFIATEARRFCRHFVDYVLLKNQATKNITSEAMNMIMP